MFIWPGSERSCLSGLARRKVGLRKVVYSAWVEEKLFILPSLEKSWSEKSCLSGQGRRRVGLRKVVFPALVGENVILRKFVYPAWVGEKVVLEKLFIHTGS